MPWIYVFAIFTIFRTFAFIFAAIVNDLIFAYNVLMLLCWIVFIVASVYGWLLVYSLYIELSDLTKLEDLAQLRVNLYIFLFNCIIFYLLITCFICFFKDGNYGFFKCFYYSFAGRFSSNDSS